MFSSGATCLVVCTAAALAFHYMSVTVILVGLERNATWTANVTFSAHAATVHDNAIPAKVSPPYPTYKRSLSLCSPRPRPPPPNTHMHLLSSLIMPSCLIALLSSCTRENVCFSSSELLGSDKGELSPKIGMAKIL